MRWFRRRSEGPHERPEEGSGGRPGERAAPARSEQRSGAASSPGDWRSYDEVAGEYARIHAPHTALVAKDLLVAADVAPGMRILDVGTGTAHALAEADSAVAPEGFSVGVDPAVGMLRAASHPRVAAAEAINLPFRDESFDVAVVNFGLAYFTKLDTALFDIRRVLKRHGKVAASVWGAGEDELTKTWRTLVEETLGRDILRAGLKDEAPWAERMSDPKRLEVTLRDAGFRPVRVSSRRYRFEIAREDYIVGHEIEAAGRYTRAMLGERLWESFGRRVRAVYAERFPATLVDFRDVLLAVGSKP